MPVAQPYPHGSTERGSEHAAEIQATVCFHIIGNLETMHGCYLPTVL
eukprot:COSAG05_NODE_20209_length_281_cov_1.390110_1_plen_46_part_10